MSEEILNYLDIFNEVTQNFPDCPALTDYSTLDGGAGNTYTYGEWRSEVLRLCGLFRSLGLKQCDHIAICGVNSSNWVVAYFAVAAFGGISVTLPTNISTDEISHLIDFSDVSALIADSVYISDLCDVFVHPIIRLEDLSIVRGDILVSYSPFSGFLINDLNKPAQICFSSGSLSKPKAVILSYLNLSNNLRYSVANLPQCHLDKSIAILPMTHTYGLLGGVLSQFPHAHHMFFLGSALTSETLLSSLSRINPYTIVVVPSIVETLYKRLGNKIKQYLGNNLQQLHVGGASFDRNVEDALLQMGIPLTVGYGMTETGPLIGGNLWSNYVPHSSGEIVWGMEARISDSGEILVRGANVMLGYYKNPEATRRKIDPDGWLHTGDRGRVDEDGTVYVYGRLEQDMIVLPSGENIVPQNIEALMDALDGVAESLVLERSGRLVALVLPSSSADLPDKASLLRAANVQLPSFSQLADIEFVTEPFQRTGKSGIKRYLYR